VISPENVVSDWPWYNWPLKLFFPSRCHFREWFLSLVCCYANWDVLFRIQSHLDANCFTFYLSCHQSSVGV
jgi:hypothetical protein